MRLDGVRVLDLTRLLPGPYATQLLADAGADVIKVEDTDTGDYARALPPFTDDGVGAVFDAVNRGKRSVAIDLKTDDGQALVHRLAADADVVVESFRPGVVDRLGVDYDTITDHNPEVVYCSISGFGQTGPLAGHVGHDLNYVGFAGLLDLTRRSDGDPPSIPGYPVADMAGGLFAAFSILGALLSRELGNTGGEHLDVSLTDVVLSFAQAVVPEAFAGADPRPGDLPLAGGLPWYDVYETADGRYVTLAALEPRFWRAFCETIEREDFVDAHGTTDPAEQAALREELTTIFATRPMADWRDEFDDGEAMVLPVQTLTEALDHSQVAARGLVDRDSGSTPRIDLPLPGTPPADAELGPPPGHGEHTAQVLRDHGLDPDRISALAADGVILDGDS